MTKKVKIVSNYLTTKIFIDFCTKKKPHKLRFLFA